jgi:two-component system response regulator RegA
VRVVIVDESGSYRDTLARQLTLIGHEAWGTDDLPTASYLLSTRPTDLIVSELRIGAQPWHVLLPLVRAHSPSARIAITTSYGSVATAIRALKLGAAAYMVKPVTATELLKTVDLGEVEVPEATEHLTLDRAIWEFISQTVESAGTISEASRRLGLDRRSLRRMLSKYAPP